MDVAAIAEVINFGALMFAIYQLLNQRKDLEKQREETRELARLTSDLDHRVHRLSVDLEKRIYRLERVRDLVNGLVKCALILHQENSPHDAKLNAAIERGMAFPELDALVRVIADPALLELFQQFIPIANHKIWPNAWNNLAYDRTLVDMLILDQGTCARQIHERVLVLMEEASRDR